MNSIIDQIILILYLENMNSGSSDKFSNSNLVQSNIG